MWWKKCMESTWCKVWHIVCALETLAIIPASEGGGTGPQDSRALSGLKNHINVITVIPVRANIIDLILSLLQPRKKKKPSPFFRCENWVSKRWTELPRATQQMSDGAGIQTQAWAQGVLTTLVPPWQIWRGFSHHLLVSGFPLGVSLGSTTNLLCDLRQIAFPLWALVFPPGKQSQCRPFWWPQSSFWYFEQSSY